MLLILFRESKLKRIDYPLFKFYTGTIFKEITKDQS